jgi:mono/diheme cytochrome c family protein
MLSRTIRILTPAALIGLACASHGKAPRVTSRPPDATAERTQTGERVGSAAPSAESVASPPATRPEAAAAAPSSEAASTTDDRAAFEATVRPVLARHCGQCHEAGGRMYAKLPFDDPEVVRAHGDSVLRRLKDPDEQAQVRRWIAAGGGTR